jgi:hypothetical protein
MPRKAETDAAAVVCPKKASGDLLVCALSPTHFIFLQPFTFLTTILEFLHTLGYFIIRSSGHDDLTHSSAQAIKWSLALDQAETLDPAETP